MATLQATKTQSHKENRLVGAVSRRRLTMHKIIANEHGLQTGG